MLDGPHADFVVQVEVHVQFVSSMKSLTEHRYFILAKTDFTNETICIPLLVH
jgi:hypothetical protein